MLNTYINLLHSRSNDLGMLDEGQTMMIARRGVFIDAIRDYGRLTLHHIEDWEKGFIKDKSRKAQNSKILFDIIMNSVCIKRVQHLQVWKQEYGGWTYSNISTFIGICRS